MGMFAGQLEINLKGDQSGPGFSEALFNPFKKTMHRHTDAALKCKS